MKHFLFCAISFLLAMLTAASAQTNNSPNMAPKPLTPLINYILQNGKSAPAEAYLLQPLGFGNNDLPVTQKSWRTQKDSMIHLFAVSQNNNSDVLMFLYTSEGVGVCWLTSPAGELRRTIKFNRSNHSAEVVPDEKTTGSFDLEKRYFLQRMKAAQTSPH